MGNLRQIVVRASGLGLIALSSACAQAGGLGSILGAPIGTGNDVYATVQDVNTSNQTVLVRTQNNQNAYVYFDNRTQVVYQNQGYPVTALQRGDVVNMRVNQTGRNQFYTDYIQVTQSAQGRYGSNRGGVYNGGVYNGGVYNGGVYNGGDRNNAGTQYTVAGSISNVDYQHGMFTVRDSNGTNTTVAMPYSPRSQDSNRFSRLRNGDYVQFRAHWVSNNRFELVRFQ